MPYYYAFSTLIRFMLIELRQTRELNVADVAAYLHKTTPTYEKLESGEAVMSMDIFFQLCTLLVVNPVALLKTAERHVTALNELRWLRMGAHSQLRVDAMKPQLTHFFEQNLRELLVNRHDPFQPMDHNCLEHWEYQLPSALRYCTDEAYRHRVTALYITAKEAQPQAPAQPTLTSRT